MIASENRPAAFPAHALSRLVIELKIEMRLHRRPFAGDNAEHHGIAQRAVRRDRVVAQNAVLLGTQTFDTAAALLIEEMRAELDRNAIELLEGMRQQQQFALRVDGA